MKTLLLTILVVLSSMSVVLAQRTFRPGYVITAQNDTLVGEVEYSDNAKSYHGCRFRKNNEVKEYLSRELTGYGYTDGGYFTTGVVEDAFAEVLVSGELNLYRYDAVYLIGKTDGKIHRLEAKETNTNIDGSGNIMRDTKWKGLVAIVTVDCKPDPSVMQKLTLNDDRLTKLVVNYNKCKGSDYRIYEQKKSKTVVKLGMSVGILHSIHKVTPYPNYYVYLVEKYTSTDPSVGLMVNFSSPGVSTRMSFQLEAIFSKSSYTSQVTVAYPGNTDIYDTEIDLTTISIPLALNYSLGGRHSLQLMGGGTFDHHIKSDATVKIEYVLPQGNITSEEPAFDVANNQVGLWAGVGLSKPFGKLKTSLVLKYFAMSRLNSNQELNINTQKVGLSIILSKN